MPWSPREKCTLSTDRSYLFIFWRSCHTSYTLSLSPSLTSDVLYSEGPLFQRHLKQSIDQWKKWSFWAILPLIQSYSVCVSSHTYLCLLCWLIDWLIDWGNLNVKVSVWLNTSNWALIPFICSSWERSLTLRPNSLPFCLGRKSNGVRNMMATLPSLAHAYTNPAILNAWMGGNCTLGENLDTACW